MADNRQKKSCKNCKHLEYIDSDGYESSASSGFCCNKRVYRTDLEEENHLGQLEYEGYLDKGKSCCDPVEIKEV